jgi:ABC-type Fe3+-siderophore transport system permease subunit
LGVTFLGLRDVSQFVWLAFLGALVVTVAVYLIGSSGRGSADPLRLTLAGPISFIGLMVPHVIRWTFGVDQRLILPLSAVLAPVILLLADVLGRIIIAPAEVPVGIVAAFVGAPVLIVLARRRKASAL